MTPRLLPTLLLLLALSAHAERDRLYSDPDPANRAGRYSAVGFGTGRSSRRGRAPAPALAR